MLVKLNHGSQKSVISNSEEDLEDLQETAT